MLLACRQIIQQLRPPAISIRLLEDLLIFQTILYVQIYMSESVQKITQVKGKVFGPFSVGSWSFPGG
jgi:hypothetical protein